MISIRIANELGFFAENKDKAAAIRTERVVPELLKKKGQVVFDFQNVEGVTQSCVHALIADPIRSIGTHVIDQMRFKNCSPNVKEIISIVVEYSQFTLDENTDLSSDSV